MARVWAEATQGVRWLGVVWLKERKRAARSGDYKKGLLARLSHASAATVKVGSDEIGGCGPLFAGCQQRTRA
jgi:hypothetical protein